MSNKVEVILTFKDQAELDLLWCQFLIARRTWRAAIDEQNDQKIMYASAWLDSLLDRLTRHLPDDLEPPTGGETSKPY